ncbi:MAG: asparagine synthase (glutamine-hydrolyzing) [Acidobacteria bacterium]|jgi:asparagine synthase (glutamine-hydrolysing)|nr:asparagine synthase (glutamine-hydrolyzing) [Acidobacteriota bacterium]MDP6421767.1 asparagine synthase (glutamine-hydrolyzing) [SAR202 cluster bacterium]MQG59568.1 asparagine synthase (glutamine-hydrolyzing) [SAR202 cluster bacterium]HAL47876.1 asparagine synthase (glutamine-hydrolyzing) [Dehalococcoidia bacterium]|tara:strand:- start:5372 stop:7312 length:1941 start_codon:yes stop_codon:yes gene_type:complete
MCGICGEVRLGNTGSVKPDDILAMREALIHRGPDDAGLFMSADRSVGLGFRRLRIVDLSANANQPLPNEDGEVRVVFNGEIYNFKELRQQLEDRGHRFRSHSDTEVIVHLYEEKGADCVSLLDGMFALAIWDQRNRRLTLARDRAGKKPLFYYHARDRVAFASEIKAFFGHPDIPTEVDPSAVPYYFIHGYVPCPNTFYHQIKQVEPATVMTVEHDGTIESRPYWSLRYPSHAELASAGPVDRRQVVGRLRQLMTQAVERRLISDVPIGAFLSGGIDSTIVVGLMSRAMPEPVKTFSIGFEGDVAYDETAYARIAAERFGTQHTEFVVEPSAVDLIDKLIWHHDGPFGDSSAVPTCIVSRLTSQQVTVVLNGDGGDELFAGYVRFYAGVLAERIPRSVARLLNAGLSRVPSPESSRHRLARAQRFFGAVNLPLYERMTRWSSLFFDDLEDLLNPEFGSSLPPIDRLRYLEREIDRMTDLSTLGRILHANFRTYLLDDLLVKMDRCAMANSLEARSPFLDRALIEYVATLPDHLKLRGRKTKVILREAFADLLPAEIANRGKMGFGVPLGAWFRGELRDFVGDLLLAGDARFRTYLSPTYVESLVRRHQAGRADLGHQLWSLLCFEQWLRLLPEWASRTTVPVGLSD